MFGSLAALVAAALVFSAVTYLVSSKNQRQIVIDRLSFSSKRRHSSSRTPPRSLSPAKKEKVSSDPNEVTYENVFPPSRRCALAELDSKTVTNLGQPREKLAESPPDSRTACAPLDQSYAGLANNAYTPCEFSTEEIKSLGDLPDYATLSGVPLPQPYHGFNLETALPRPYRPFRWAYHQTMSLTKMEPDWWLEIDRNYEKRIKQRKELLEKNGKLVLDALPGSELACKELMEMVLQFLCARYPQHFALDKENMVFHNHILDSQTDLKAVAPLNVIMDNCPEDFAIMLRDPENGFYVFRAGVICSSLGWSLGSKINKRLHQIHEPIPDYKEKMQFSMDRYFTKKPTDKPIQRGSWGLEVDEPLFMPPGDPHEKYRDMQAPDLDISQCNLRVDWQTLRRLPLSGAVVFNFKALFTPIEEFREEPYIPSLLLKVLRDGKKSLMEYKNTWHTEHVIVPALEKYEKEQIEKGWVPKDWEHHTLEKSPFFPGWEEKWHQQQGF